MFVLLLYVAMVFVFLTILMLCISVKNKILRYLSCILSGMLIVVLVTSFAVDLFFYIKGDKVSCEYVKLSEHKTPGYFTVNDTYWGVGGYFAEYKMVTKQNEKDMEIRVIEVEPDVEDKICAVCYLPISKFVTCIKVPRTNSSGKAVYYDVYKYNYRACETNLMKYITVLCIVVFILRTSRTQE